MTEIKLGETGGADLTPIEPVSNRWVDWAARALLMMIFTALAFLGAVKIFYYLPVDSIHKLLVVAASVANVLFLSLVAATTLTRLAPVRKSSGIEPRLSALLGSFLCMALVFLPKADLPPILSITSTVLIITGASLSFAVLRWLGKSFSILAEARRLVTEGPYRVVRHPLYICEAIAAIGVMLQVISPLAMLIVLAAGALQYRRMINEEKILNAAFPEYRAYAARTPLVLPAGLAALCGRSGPA
jgi:protein-S-isoprenylcysteine O-methyltransferase Ste14